METDIDKSDVSMEDTAPLLKNSPKSSQILVADDVHVDVIDVSSDGMSCTSEERKLCGCKIGLFNVIVMASALMALSAAFNPIQSLQSTTQQGTDGVFNVVVYFIINYLIVFRSQLYIVVLFIIVLLIIAL